MNLFVILYLVNFIRTLFVILIIYYAIRLVVRYVFPMIVDKGVKNMQQKMYNQKGQNQRPTRPEGEVTIENNKRTGGNSSQDQGEYIDFEEVD